MTSDKITKKMTEMTRLMIDSITELQKINDNTVRELAKQQLDAIEEFNATGARQLDELASAKSAKELLTTQTEIAAEVAKDMKANAMRAMEVLSQGQKELKTFLDKNVQQFIEKTKVK
ncbi:MAG: phasin family protein [Magnetococcales bacterium]|nr:phasin family protein [Magnetococcales bacterium]MBF0439042.1 phasin family protein [Magnetococcales bacterium]